MGTINIEIGARTRDFKTLKHRICLNTVSRQNILLWNHSIHSPTNLRLPPPVDLLSITLPIYTTPTYLFLRPFPDQTKTQISIISPERLPQ